MMFVGSPIPYIQASDLNQTVFLCLFQDALCEGSRAEVREKRQDVERDHFREFRIQALQEFNRMRQGRNVGLNEQASSN